MKGEAVWFGNKVVELRLFNFSGDQAMQTDHLPSAEARTDVCARALVMTWCSYIYTMQLPQSPMFHFVRFTFGVISRVTLRVLTYILGMAGTKSAAFGHNHARSELNRWCLQENQSKQPTPDCCY